MKLPNYVAHAFLLLLASCASELLKEPLVVVRSGSSAASPPGADRVRKPLTKEERREVFEAA